MIAAMNYSRALARWVSNSRPTRDDAEVGRLREMCRTCELFDGKICTHKDCRCRVVDPAFWGDKLRWATEHCPIGKW